jgi:hypothetical protein
VLTYFAVEYAHLLSGQPPRRGSTRRSGGRRAK